MINTELPIVGTPDSTVKLQFKDFKTKPLIIWLERFGYEISRLFLKYIGKLEALTNNELTNNELTNNKKSETDQLMLNNLKLICKVSFNNLKSFFNRLESDSIDFTLLFERPDFLKLWLEFYNLFSDLNEQDYPEDITLDFELINGLYLKNLIKYYQTQKYQVNINFAPPILGEEAYLYAAISESGDVKVGVAQNCNDRNGGKNVVAIPIIRSNYLTCLLLEQALHRVSLASGSISDINSFINAYFCISLDNTKDLLSLYKKYLVKILNKELIPFLERFINEYSNLSFTQFIDENPQVLENPEDLVGCNYQPKADAIRDLPINASSCYVVSNLRALKKAFNTKDLFSFAANVVYQDDDKKPSIILIKVPVVTETKDSQSKINPGYAYLVLLPPVLEKISINNESGSSMLTISEENLGSLRLLGKRRLGLIKKAEIKMQIKALVARKVLQCQEESIFIEAKQHIWQRSFESLVNVILSTTGRNKKNYDAVIAIFKDSKIQNMDLGSIQRVLITELINPNQVFNTSDSPQVTINDLWLDKIINISLCNCGLEKLEMYAHSIASIISVCYYNFHDFKNIARITLVVNQQTPEEVNLHNYILDLINKKIKTASLKTKQNTTKIPA